MAVKLALEEALKRGLINSEMNLFDQKFKVEPMAGKLFPPVENNRIRKKVIKSIARAVLLVGVIPVVFSVLGILKDNLIEAVLLLAMGAIWLYNAWALMQKQKLQNLQFLLLIAYASIIYIARFFLGLKGIQVMDVALTIAFYILLFYGLFYVRKLIKADTPQ